MEMFLEHMIWLNSQVNANLCQQVTGTFLALSTHGECELELELSRDGLLRGSFKVAKQVLEIKGGVGQRGTVYGFLLEPFASVPVVLFRLSTSLAGLNIEFDMPEFADLINPCQAAQLVLTRVENRNAQGLSRQEERLC
jgi:hypothetical protein